MNRRMDDRYQSMGELIRDLKLCMKNPEGTTLHASARDDASGKTMVFTHKQVEQIKEQITGRDKKSQKTGKKKSKAEHAKSASKKKTQQKKDDGLLEEKFKIENFDLIVWEYVTVKK